MTGTPWEFQGTDVFMMEYIDQDAISQDTHTWYSLPARPHCKSVIQPAYLLQPAPPPLSPHLYPPPLSAQLVVCTTDLYSSVSDNTHSFHFARSTRSVIVETQEGGGQFILCWMTGVRFLGGPGNFPLIFYAILRLHLLPVTCLLHLSPILNLIIFGNEYKSPNLRFIFFRFCS
jgi:hypothetical protein